MVCLPSTGLVTEQQYGRQVAKGMDNFALLQTVYDPSLKMAPSDKALVFVDSHLSQRDTSIPSGMKPLTYMLKYFPYVFFFLVQ